MSTENTPTPDPGEEGLNHLERLNERLRKLLGPEWVITSPQEPPAQEGPLNVRFTFIPREGGGDDGSDEGRDPS